MTPDEIKSVYKCPACYGELQLTRKLYYSVYVNDDGATVEQVQTDQPDMWSLYCENDHELSEFECDWTAIDTYVATVVGQINRSQADPSWGEGNQSL